MSRFRADDLTLLLPSFERKAREVLAAMVSLGYDPVPFDTLRTPAEAAKLFARGVGSRNSMHCYGVACDVICGKHGWDCSASGCKFFCALGEVVESLGLVWGGRWKSRNDLPHFQLCSVADQDAVRAIKDPAERDTFCAKRMANLV
jgi:peptidoglycan L-alanyl-D-glutamate endopeptidase CwlK